MIFDIEADGLLNTITKIHVLAYSTPNGVKYTHDYFEMRSILSNAKLLIGHNIVTYDVPAVERILGIKIKAKLIDTLALSWYLNHKRGAHGLDSYGKDYGIPKPKIDDWENLTPEEYAHRCVEDVKINTALWGDLKKKLLRIYDTKAQADKLLEYLTFKMTCLRMQEESKWKMNRKLVTVTHDKLVEAKLLKVDELKGVMPKVEKWGKKSKPPKPFKKDGTVSVAGANWFHLLKEEGLPEDYNGEVSIFLRDEDPNPNSVPQVKAWLFSLGWVPENFDFKKGDNAPDRYIPQIRIDKGDGKVLCPSVKALIEENPTVGVLDGLTILQHRISILSGFLESANDKDELVAGAAGLTNTLRFRHRVLVNLPGVNKAYGKEVRGSLVAKDGYELCGSDMVSLEETTKKHYMFPYDPEFVADMSTPGFDAHLDLAKHAGRVTQADIDRYVEVKASLDNGKKVLDKDVAHVALIGSIRKIYKAANYACVYGVGGATLARSAGLKVPEANSLIETYWKRNWAVKRACEDIKIKKVGNEMWLLNPVSGLYYSLRNMKDVFSTLNQGTGVYCFDSWIMEIFKHRKQLTAQFHDEIVLEIKKGARDKCTKLLKMCISKVNERLKLNLDLDVDIQFGQNYAEIH